MLEETQPEKVVPDKKLIIVLYAVELIIMGTRRRTGHFVGVTRQSKT